MFNDITTTLDLTAALFTLIYMAKLVFDSFFSSFPGSWTLGDWTERIQKRSLLNQQVERRVY